MKKTSGPRKLSVTLNSDWRVSSGDQATKRANYTMRAKNAESPGRKRRRGGVGCETLGL